MCYQIRSFKNVAISLEICVFGVQARISLLGLVDGFWGLLAACWWSAACWQRFWQLSAVCWRSLGAACGLLAACLRALAAFWRVCVYVHVLHVSVYGHVNVYNLISGGRGSLPTSIAQCHIPNVCFCVFVCTCVRIWPRE